MKDFNGIASTRINIVLPVVGGIFNGQAVEYFIHYVKELSVLHCFALHCDFQELKLLPRMSQYVLSQLVCVVNNGDQFFINS